MIADALPWTVGLLGMTTLLSFAHRHAAGCAAGLARRAALDALADAAALGAACHPVLPAGPDPDVPAGVPVPAAADLRRLHRRRDAVADRGFVLDVLSHALLPALSIVLVATGGWALGMRGMMVDHHGRGLRHLRRGKRAAELDHFPALLPPQRDPAADHRSGARAWDRSCRARCWWR